MCEGGWRSTDKQNKKKKNYSIYAWYKSRVAPLISAKLLFEITEQRPPQAHLFWVEFVCVGRPTQGHLNSGKSREASVVPTHS